MAELSDFKGITIYMHSDPNSKHESPHFHAKHEYDYDVFDASYGIPLLNKIVGDFPKDKEKLVLKWAQLHLDKLQQNWDFLIKGKPPKIIQPLQKRGLYRGVKKYNPYHRIIGFKIVDDYVIELFFNDGFIREVDFYPLLEKLETNTYYGALKNLDLFNKVTIDGGKLYWPNNLHWSDRDLYHWDKVEENYRNWMRSWDNAV